MMRPRRLRPDKETLLFTASDKDKETFQKNTHQRGERLLSDCHKHIEAAEFLLEYVIRHISGSEGETLFKDVDGSTNETRLGRSINYDHIRSNSKVNIIHDEKKSPHLCAFAVTKIDAGEEVLYNNGDPQCHWRHETPASYCDVPKAKMESRWRNLFENIESEPDVMKIDGLVFTTKRKIANGCNAAEIFPGVFQNSPVAVKRVAKHISKNELEMAYFLSSEDLHGEHLLQPMAVLEDTYFAYFVSPLCEYNLSDLIESKEFPERKYLTDQRRLGICKELLQGLQELHCYGILHTDLKPENILFDINNKLYIADFKASKKLDLTPKRLFSQMAGSFVWSSFEDVGGLKYKYKKESDIQVAGCLMHYILTDGQHPYQTMTPYSADPVGLSQNVRTGNFTLQCGDRWVNQEQIITRMLSRSYEARPTIEECLQAVTCFRHQSDCTGSTSNLDNESTYKTTEQEMSLSLEQFVSDEHQQAEGAGNNPQQQNNDQTEITGSDMMDSSTLTEDEASLHMMATEQHVSLFLEMSDEEEQHADKATEIEIFEEKPPSKRQQTRKAHGSNPQQKKNNQPEFTGSDEMESSFPIKEEQPMHWTVTEHQFSLSLEMSDEEEPQVAKAKEEVVKKKLIWRKPSSKSPKPMADIINEENLQKPDIQVKMSSNKGHQRIYDKKNYCLFCEKPFVKISRHLKQKHFDKPEVAKALAHRQGSDMRTRLMSKLRNMGNYHHNCLVLSSGKGEIIPKRQATHASSATDYLPCKFCFAMYVKTDLWKHHKRCKLQVKDDRPVKRRIQTSSSLLLPMNITVSAGLKTVLEDMAYDAVTHLVKSDALIIALGERMLLKNGEVKHHRAEIRNRMRELARLVLAARTIDTDIVFLKDLINPGKFNTVLEAVKKMTGFDNLSNRFSAPSTALKLRNSLMKVSYILQGEALRQEDDTLKGRAEQFIKLIELEWTTQRKE